MVLTWSSFVDLCIIGFNWCPLTQVSKWQLFSATSGELENTISDMSDCSPCYSRVVCNWETIVSEELNLKSFIDEVRLKHSIA